MTQNELPLRGGARRTDPPTSHAAAAKVNVTRLQRIILKTLKAHGPLTISEVAAANRLPRDSLSPRMKGLVEKLELVQDTGTTAVPSRFGLEELQRTNPEIKFREQTVYGLTTKGAEAVT